MKRAIPIPTLIPDIGSIRSLNVAFGRRNIRICGRLFPIIASPITARGVEDERFGLPPAHESDRGMVEAPSRSSTIRSGI
jgi:hypothetical protein